MQANHPCSGGPGNNSRFRSGQVQQALVLSDRSTTVTNTAASCLPHLIDTSKAAEILGRRPNTLKRWRYEGIGPAYVEIEGRVSYDLAVLLEYIRENTRVPSVRAAMEASRER
jgi:hypothetical protein